MSQNCDNHIHFDLYLANPTNFWLLEVVDCGSETQPHVGEELIYSLPGGSMG